MRPGNISSRLRMTDTCMQANMQRSTSFALSKAARRERPRSSASVAHCICKCALQRHCNALLSDILSPSVRLRAERKRTNLSKQVSALMSHTSHMRYYVHIPCGRYFVSRTSCSSHVCQSTRSYYYWLSSKLPCTYPK
jgi:hypothetical protein